MPKPSQRPTGSITTRDPTPKVDPPQLGWVEIAREGGSAQGITVTDAANLPGRGCVIRTRFTKILRGSIVATESACVVPWCRIVRGVLVEDTTAEAEAA